MRSKTSILESSDRVVLVGRDSPEFVAESFEEFVDLLLLCTKERLSMFLSTVRSSPKEIERQPHEGWLEGALSVIPLSRIFKLERAGRTAADYYRRLPPADRNALQELFGRTAKGA